jgi:hypothetical protein
MSTVVFVFVYYFLCLMGVMDLKSELPTDICMDDVDDNDCLYLYERDDDDIMGFLDIPDNLSDEIDQEE